MFQSSPQRGDGTIDQLMVSSLLQGFTGARGLEWNVQLNQNVLRLQRKPEERVYGKIQLIFERFELKSDILIGLL